MSDIADELKALAREMAGVAGMHPAVGGALNRWATRLTAIAQGVGEADPRLAGVLGAAVCPMAAQGCDGNGYPVGNPRGDCWQEQCQWCHERRELLAALTPQQDTGGE